MIRSRQLEEITVFYVSRRFATQYLARRVWDEINRRLSGKNLDLGVYRHGTEAHPGTAVTVLSLLPEGVVRAERLMRQGTDVDFADDGDFSWRELDSLIARRARMVVAAPPGMDSEILHHGEGRRLLPDGTFE
jgi:hypothetical protein